jgi:hypothetical protein
MRNDMSATNAPTTESPASLPTPWRPVDDWSTLKDHHVEIHIGGKLIDQGRVDDVTPDGAVLWLMLDGASGRRIIENQPGTYVRSTAPK